VAAPIPRVPADFPLVSQYCLDERNKPKDGFVPRVVMYTRTADQETLQDARWYVDPQLAFRAWLREFGGWRTRDTLTRPHSLAVKWIGAAALIRDVEKERKAMTADFDAMVAELLKNRALTRDEAKAARPTIRVDVDDQRGGSRQALPDLSKPPRRVPDRM
jgi:hypothetical protein